MELDSVKALQQEVIERLERQSIRAFGAPSSTSKQFHFPFGVGIHPTNQKGDYQLSLHKPDKSYLSLIESVKSLARGEVDIQITGKAFAFCRNLCIGASISHCHPLAQAGTLGGFVRECGQSDLLIL